MNIHGDPTMRSILIAGAALLALSACNRNDAPAPEESPGPEASAVPSEPVSIIRPDIEEARMVPLEPLDVVLPFGESGAELTGQNIARLQEVIASRAMAEGGDVVIRGHSDSGGTDEANLRASRARAVAVRDWLVDNEVDEARIEVIAFGEQNPIEPNALPDGEPNEAGRAANRRVEIHVEVPEGTMIEVEPAPTDTATAMPVPPSPENREPGS